MIRVNAVLPTHVNSPLLMNEATYRAFRPDLENPGPDDLAPICQSFHYLPIPWVTPEDISNAVLFLASDEGALHHRRGPSRRRGQLPEVRNAPMTVTNDTDVYYDPYYVNINADPYPTYARLREEAPIYYNDRYDFWGAVRHSDVECALANWGIDQCSDILELIQSKFDMPAGVTTFQDPPEHTRLRGLMSRVFTPRRMAELEDQIRHTCGAWTRSSARKDSTSSPSWPR